MTDQLYTGPRRYGRVKFTTIQATKNELRQAIQEEGTERIKDLWEKLFFLRDPIASNLKVCIYNQNKCTFFLTPDPSRDRKWRHDNPPPEQGTRYGPRPT